MAVKINDQTQEANPSVNALIPLAQPDGGGGFLGRSATIYDIVKNAPEGGYREYVALLTQFSSNAPTAIVLKNTLGGDPVIARDGAGEYSVTLAGAFVTGKTIAWITPSTSVPWPSLIHAFQYDIDTVTIFTQYRTTMSPTPTRSDSMLLDNSPFSIRVYD